MLVCLALNEQFIGIFFLHFHLCSGHRKGLEDKMYPAMDSPVHGEPNGVKMTAFIHKL